MTREFEYDGEQAPQPSSEAFMEPRTIPKKWDVSAFKSPETSPRDASADQSSESDTPESTSTYEGDETEATFDPFPKPRTVPGNWDVSDLI
jgi:hypothetical protein